jgi:hypothetical protein
VWPVEPDPTNVLPGNEALDVDRARALEPHGLELLVLEDHEAVVLDLVALGLIVLGDRFAGLGVDILALDAVAGFPVDRMERSVSPAVRAGSIVTGQVTSESFR